MIRGFLVATAISVFAASHSLVLEAADPTTAASTVDTTPRFAPASRDVVRMRRTLLEKRWQYSKENKAAAAQEYAALRATGEAGPADEFLYALVRFRNHEYTEAIAAIDAAIKANPDDSLLLRTRVWMALERNELDAAWPVLARYQRHVLAESKTGARSPAEHADDLAFLGQVHGFLAGPYAGRANERLTSELRDAVARELSLDDLRAFEAAERSVEEKRERLAAERDRLVAKAQDELKATAEAKRAELEKRKQDLEKAQGRILPEQDRVAERSQDVLTELTKAEALAASSAEIVARQGAALEFELESALDRLDLLYGWLDAIAPVPVPGRPQPAPTLQEVNILQNIFNTRNQINGLDQQLQALERSYAGLNGQFAQIRQRRIDEETALERNLTRLQIDSERLERELAELDRHDGSPGGSDLPKSRDVRALEKLAGELDPYLDFSLEEVRRKLLDELATR